MFLKINRDYAIALILAMIALGICALKMTESFRMVDDSAAYVSQAIALTQGTTSEFIAENLAMIGKYDLAYMTPTTYPWGFPMLLMPLYKIFGFNIVAFKSVDVICYALFVGIFYIFCANRLPRIYAIFATLLFAINPYMTNFSANEIYSDIPFMLFGFITLIILAKLFGESKSKNGIAIATFGGIFMLFSTMIRINGFVILCALIAMQGILLLKRFAPKIFKAKILKPFSHTDSPYAWQIHAIPYAIFIVGFAIVSITLSSGTGRHLDYLAEISPQTILRNLSLMKFSLFMPLNTDIDSLLLWLCVPFILLGIYANFRESSAKSIETIFYIIFVVGFFALLLLWIDFEVRFLFLTLPFFVLWCAKGFTLIGKKLFRLSLAMLMVVILLNLVWINARDISFIKSSDISQEDAYSAESKQLYKFIINNTPKNAIIISFKPRILYLNTHRLSFVSPNIKRLNEADFVLWNGKYTSDFDKRSMQDIFSPEFQCKTKLIFQNAEYKLFKVLK